MFLGYAMGGHYKLIDAMGCMFISCDIIFEKGLPCHTLSSVGESEPSDELFPDVLRPALDENTDQSTSDASNTETPQHITAPEPVLETPQLCRSIQNITITCATTESRSYQQSEVNAQAKGED